MQVSLFIPNDQIIARTHIRRGQSGSVVCVFVMKDPLAGLLMKNLFIFNIYIWNQVVDIAHVTEETEL